MGYMVTKAETSMTASSQDRALAHLIDFLAVYLAVFAAVHLTVSYLVRVVGPIFLPFFVLDLLSNGVLDTLTYTIVRGLCFSCRDYLVGESIFLSQLILTSVFLLFFSLNIFLGWLLEDTLGGLGGKLMRIKIEGNGYQLLGTVFRRTSWIGAIIVIPLGYKILMLLVTILTFYTLRHSTTRTS